MADSSPDRTWILRTDLAFVEVSGLNPAKEPHVLVRDLRTFQQFLLEDEEALILRSLQLGGQCTADTVRTLCARTFDRQIDLDEIRVVLLRFDAFGLLQREDPVAMQWTERRRILAAQQLRDLSRTVRHVYQNIPFYRMRSQEPPSLESVEDLASLPLLRKADVRRHLPDLLLPEADAYRSSWMSTSGTSGERLQVHHLGQYLRDCVEKTLLLNPTVARAFASGSQAVLTTPVCSGTECHRDMQLSYDDRLRWGGQLLILNSSMDPIHFRAEQLEEHVADLRRHQPRLLTCNLSYLLGLALHLRKTKQRLPRIEAITATYELPSKIQKRIVSEVFECPVYETYGGTEFGYVAIECDHGRMHVSPRTHVLELLDASGAPVGSGEVGQVALTALSMLSTPLLRYLPGDFALADSRRCECGSAEHTFGRIEGKTTDLIQRTDGSMVTPRQVDDVVSALPPGITWYALHQQGEQQYRLRFVRDEGFREALADDARDALLPLLGPGAQVTVQETEAIRPGSSGKFSLCSQVGNWPKQSAFQSQLSERS